MLLPGSVSPPDITSRGGGYHHQMSLAEGWVSPPDVTSRRGWVSPPDVTNRAQGGYPGGGGGWVSYLSHDACEIPKPLNRMTDTCENITFPQFLWRAVKMEANVRKIIEKTTNIRGSFRFRFPFRSVWTSRKTETNGKFAIIFAAALCWKAQVCSCERNLIKVACHYL